MLGLAIFSGENPEQEEKPTRSWVGLAGHAVSIRLHEKLFDYLLMIVIDARIKRPEMKAACDLVLGR